MLSVIYNIGIKKTVILHTILPSSRHRSPRNSEPLLQVRIEPVSTPCSSLTRHTSKLVGTYECKMHFRLTNCSLRHHSAHIVSFLFDVAFFFAAGSNPKLRKTQNAGKSILWKSLKGGRWCPHSPSLPHIPSGRLLLRARSSYLSRDRH
jgi:hypothetical protein